MYPMNFNNRDFQNKRKSNGEIIVMAAQLKYMSPITVQLKSMHNPTHKHI